MSKLSKHAAIPDEEMDEVSGGTSVMHSLDGKNLSYRRGKNDVPKASNSVYRSVKGDKAIATDLGLGSKNATSVTFRNSGGLC